VTELVLVATPPADAARVDEWLAGLAHGWIGAA
jgi:hypothetical protein